MLGKQDYTFDNLALRILMNRVRMSVGFDASESKVSACIEEIRAFFEKYGSIAQPDLNKIFPN